MEEVSFRDRPINIDSTGKRKWVYVKKTKGKLFTARTIVSIVLILLFVGLPIVKVNGHPLMLLDIVGRKFIIFGAIFWAQDTFILAILMLSFVMFIILFTVTYGRIWCGWACPQTIFLEMIYRKVEILIEGDYKHRAKRDQGAWNFDKVIRKLAKHSIFIIISVTITNVFLMWFVGFEGLIDILKDPIDEHLSGFLTMLLISAVFYWIYASFREQICTMVCPYGRMQGVLLDSKSVIVTYDYNRGEPRGGKEAGDCIDCKQCLAVCPTGIDIRNGSQLECINCTSCIDECNNVMKKIKKPQGLIRFDSIEGIEKKHKTIWNTRNKAYTGVLIVLLGFFVYLIVSRPIVESTILRAPNTLYQVRADGKITNIYNIKILNKTYLEKELIVKLLNPKGELTVVGNEIRLKAHGMFSSVLITSIAKTDLTGSKTELEFGVFEKDKLLETYSVSFVGP